MSAMFAMLASCHSEQTRYVAIGWRGNVDDLFSRCVPVAATPTNIVSRGADYEAVAAGTEDFTCGRNVIHVRVSPAIRIGVDFPASIAVSTHHLLYVWGDDGSGRKLDLGGQYTDTLGVLERPGCNDMDFLCGVGGEMLFARKPGRGSVTASFHGLTATRDVVAFAATDAGAD